MIDFICELIRRLFARGPRVRCERNSSWTDLVPSRVAVGVSHNDQKDLLRARLDSAGRSDVVVETANKLQGLEFDVVIAWHPLAGTPDPDEFHLDPGRLCVLLTRHRHACIVLGRAADRQLLQAVPPTTPAYLRWDPDPMLDGWDVHRRYSPLWRRTE
jgi:AAA domain